MPDVEQVPQKERRSQTAVRELRATITIDEVDVRGLLAAIQQPVLEAVAEKLATTERPAACAPAPAPVVPEKPTGGLNLPDAERLKAADLRTALLLGKVPDTAGLLIDTRTTAKLLNVSSKTLSRLNTLEAIPQPVRIGGKIIRWRLAEILAWMDAGCPRRGIWTFPEGSQPTKRRR